MKTIGLIGGTTWVSTVDYYKIINSETNKRLGKNNSARIIMYSVNFQDAIDLMSKKDFEGMKQMLFRASDVLVKGGAECLLLCANTMHKYADDVQQYAGLPLVHIADETARKIKEKGISKVGLLGTKLTMSEPFSKERLAAFGIETLVHGEEQQDFVNYIIFNELAKEEFKSETKAELINIIGGLQSKGAEGVIMGCTEIPLILKQGDADIPLFDTLTIHSMAAVDFSLQDE